MSGADSAVPTPGVSNLVSKYGYRGETLNNAPGVPPPGVSTAGGGFSKQSSQSHIPEHLRDETDRDETDRNYAIAHFPSVPMGLPSDPNEPVGYVITIPLNKKAVASSMVRNGALPERVFKKYEHFYKDEERPVMVNKRANLTSIGPEEIPDEDFEPVTKLAAEVDQINPLPPYDPAGQRQMTKKMNEPMTWEVQQPKALPGEVQKRTDKNLYDTIKKTKLPWEQFKKASWISEKVEKFASAFGLNVPQMSNPSLWQTTDVDPMTFDLILVGNFGKDWIDWEPETLWEMIGRIGGVNVSQEVKDKIQALKTLHSGPWFWEDEGIFEKVCLALNGVEPNFEERQNLNLPQIAKAVVVANKIKTEQFTEEVMSHIAVKAHQEGFLVLPSMLAFAQPMLSSLTKGLDGLVAQVQTAYNNGAQAGTDDMPVNVQLRKLYATESYVSLA